jgi:glycolate oxidase FAD binding subunit
MRPTTIEKLAKIVADAAASGAKLELRGGGTKADIGAPHEARTLDMTGFMGILDYDPAELVLTAGAGTPLSVIEAAVTERSQMLAFEPYGEGATIGGIVAASVSGSRRLSRGPVRDHLLGFRAVSGRGEAFVGGAKVVKNVTGYDLPKIIAGSWGRLAALTEVTLKVLPQLSVTVTLVAEGLQPGDAVELMSKAMGSQADVAAAAHLPGMTAIRLEGFGPSVEARRKVLERIALMRAIAEDEARAFWATLRIPLLNEEILWRINIPPSRAADFVTGQTGSWQMDWAGGLIWLASDNAVAVRQSAEAMGGHAFLARAPEAFRRAVPTLHPQPRGVAALEQRVRNAFDPMGVFETGRF